MAWYLYPPMVALDANGVVVRSGTGQIFAEGDTAGTTPLVLQDINGATITQVQVNDLGLTQAFRAETPEAVWRSGSFAVPLSSSKGMREAADLSASLAADSAEAAILAQAAAEQAASNTVQELPQDGSTGQILAKASPAPGDVQWVNPPTGGGTGVTDHGGLTGLADDDHPQYLTEQRGDARYYTKAAVDSAVSSAATQTSAADRSRSNHTGTQPISSVTNLETRLSALEAGGGGGGGPITTDSITDMTATGKAVAKASSASAARTAIGAGTSNLQLGNITGTAADAGLVAGLLDQKANVSHTHTAAQVTDLAAAVEPIVAEQASELGDQAVARTVYGSQNGEILPPWNTNKVIGPECWLTANMHASGAQTLTPTLTANGSPQELIVYVKMDDFNNGGLDPWRLEFDFEAPASGWASIYVAMQQSNQTNLSGTADQYLVTHESPQRSGRIVVDFQAPDFNGGFVYLKVRLKMENNVTSGQILRMTNVSLKRIPRLAPPMLVSYGFSPGAPTVWMRHANSRGVRKTTKTLLNGGGLASTLEYDGWTPWRWSLPDPEFRETSTAYDGKTGSDETKTGISTFELNAGNNDQILSVQTPTAGVFELRGNVHGGEEPVTTAYKIDEGKGAGLVPWTPGSSLSYLKPCRRYQVQWDTKLVRSADASSSPFANVAHTTTVFDDGMMRTDRSTTFPKAAVIGDNFEWMSSHGLSPLWLGRLGKGQTVIADVDTRGLLAPPAQPTATPSASGGTLAAGTRYYYVTAVSEYGETTVSPQRSATTSGSTGSVALTWTAVSGATGYRIYRSSSSSARPQLIGSTLTNSFTDTNATAPLAVIPPPQTNTARTATPTRREATATDATWSVWYDPQYDLCYANIFDRDALLNRAGVQAAATRLQMIPGSITKEYINAIWNTADGTVSVGPSTPAWTVTHWSYIYSPNDPVNFHKEVADKAANLGALKAMYPTT